MSAADGVAGTSMSSTAVGESAVTFAFSALDNTSTLRNLTDQKQEAAVSDQVKVSTSQRPAAITRRRA